MKKEMKMPQPPTADQLRAELLRERRRRDFGRAQRGAVTALLLVAAAAVLASALFFPVLRVVGSGMTPTLEAGEIVVVLKGGECSAGDIVAFYDNNKILIKRVIGVGGDTVSIDEAGKVSVNGEMLEEGYLTERSLGECDVSFPYRVPDGTVFVLGDRRSASADSRLQTVGCIAREYIIGKIVLRVWPLNRVAQFGESWRYFG